MAPKPFSFTGMVNDLTGAIDKQAELLRPRVVFGYFWDGKITKGNKEMDRLTDEQIKQLVIQGNIMISAAANLRIKREAEREKKGKTDGVG